MAQENLMEQDGKIWDFLASQVFDDDELYDFAQLSDDEKWDWWNKNKKFYAKEPGFSEVGMLTKSKDWKSELSKYPEYMLDDEVLQEIAENNDLDVESLKQYREENKQEREYQEGRKRREKEIKESGLISPWTLASEYSKQRYIDDPDASLFGKEGDFNPYSTQGQEELGDVIFGGTGAFADLIPGLGVAAGPVVRGARDVSHKVSDSPYQKEWSEIGGDIGTDLMFNVGTDYLPTFIINQGSKLAKNIAPTAGAKIAQSVKNIQDVRAMDKDLSNLRMGLKKFDKTNIPTINQQAEEVVKDGVSPTRLSTYMVKNMLRNQKKTSQWVNSLPDSPFKDDMMSFVSSKSYNPREMAQRIVEWKQKGENPYNVYGTEKGIIVTPYAAQTSDPVFQFAKRKSDLPQLSTKEKIGKTIADKYETVGGAIVKEMNTVRGRGSKPQETEKAKLERWSKGFATPDEMRTKEYEDFKLEQLNMRELGL